MVVDVLGNLEDSLYTRLMDILPVISIHDHLQCYQYLSDILLHYGRN